MNLYVFFSILVGIFFFLHGLLIKKNPSFLSIFIKHKYPPQIIVKAHKKSSFLTSFSALIIAYLIYDGVLQNEFFMLSAIVWAVSNFIFLSRPSVM